MSFCFPLGMVALCEQTSAAKVNEMTDEALTKAIEVVQAVDFNQPGLQHNFLVRKLLRFQS